MAEDESGRSTASPEQAMDQPRVVPKQVPQKTIDDFWTVFNTKYPGRIHSLLPRNIKAKIKAEHEPRGAAHEEAALSSYQEARDNCASTVAKISKECRRVNMRYRDPHFDIEFDLKRRILDCLEGLNSSSVPFEPKAVKRVPEIFEKPQFFIDGASTADIRQGKDGDCWLLSALCALGSGKGLINKICVASDPQVGVYGFVFHRDGEWKQTIIDDKLYLNSADYDESTDEKEAWLQVFNRVDAEEEYRRVYQTGSRALYFAQCSDQNETWLPLLEKAYAKAHDDYRAIDGGFTGEAIEDLTGGVSTELFTTDILDKERFWAELLQVNKDFLFGCATGVFDDWQGGGSMTDRRGVLARHAYSIVETREIDGERLLCLRNPWGKSEWQGAWSDGSPQWTGEWLKKLDHTFGNDGLFWISYEDILRKFQCFDRTRLFDDTWVITQKWTSVNVPWSVVYNDTKFTITLSQKTPVVIVLSQLDYRYWKCFEGQYVFLLHFRLDKEGEEDYIARSHGNYLQDRSVSLDLPELEAGTYNVKMKITAKRFPGLLTPDQILREYCKTRPAKVLRVGLSYDLAHAKGTIKETEEEKKVRQEREERAQTARKKKLREVARLQKRKAWDLQKARKERELRHKNRREAHREKKRLAQKAANTPATEAANEEEVEKGDNIPIDAAADVNVTPKNDAKDDVELNVHPTPADKAEAEEIQESEGEAEPVEAPSTTKIDALATPPPEQSIIAAQTIVEAEPVAGKDVTAQDRIEKYNKDSALQTDENENGKEEGKEEEEEEKEEEDGGAKTGSHAAAASANADSDTSSLLSFDSSIDTLLDLSDDGEQDSGTQTAANGAYAADDNADDDEDNVEFANDPWNAVCVIGLRVFSREGEVTVAVVRPKTGDDDDDTPLDDDDPSKGVSYDAPPLSPSLTKLDGADTAASEVKAGDRV